MLTLIAGFDLPIDDSYFRGKLSYQSGGTLYLVSCGPLYVCVWGVECKLLQIKYKQMLVTSAQSQQRDPRDCGT